MLRITGVVNLRSSQVFAEPLAGHFLTRPICEVVIECPKREEIAKMQGQKRACLPFKSPGSHFSHRGRILQTIGKIQKQWPPNPLSALL